MNALTMIATDNNIYAPAGPPTTDLHDPEGHASPPALHMAELPNVQGTQPGNLTCSARGKAQHNPRLMGRGTAPGRPHPADALRTSCGWSWSQMASTYTKQFPYARPFGPRSLVRRTRPTRDPARKKHCKYDEKAVGYQGAWVK